MSDRGRTSYARAAAGYDAGLKRDTAVDDVAGIDRFRARCAADAKLYADGSLGLPDAVDRSQQYAEAYGLLQIIGQDAVQQIIAEAFGRVR
jgi:hypothetical protein